MGKYVIIALVWYDIRGGGPGGTPYLTLGRHTTMGIFASEKCINKELQNSKNREKESNLSLFLGRKSLKNRKNDE